jgi:hypothetical protein
MTTAALLAGSARPCEAQERSLRLPTAAYFVAAGADVGSQLYSSHWGGLEADPAIAWLEPAVGTAPMLAIGEAADITAVVLWNRWLGPRHPVLTRVGLYVIAGVRTSIAIGNVRKAHDYRDYVRGGGTVIDGRMAPGQR